MSILKTVGIGIAIFIGVLFATGLLGGVLEAALKIGSDAQGAIALVGVVLAIVADVAYFMIAARKRRA